MVVTGSNGSVTEARANASLPIAPLPFAALFHRNKKAIYSFCLRITADISQAEALAEVSFLQAFRKFAETPSDPAFSTWLYDATGRNLFSSGAFSVAGAKDDDDKEPALQANGERSAIRGGILRDDLLHSIEHLSLRRRAIFALREIEGMTHSEIARLLGCSESHSKAELHQARLQVRQSLLVRVRENAAAKSERDGQSAQRAGFRVCEQPFLGSGTAG